MYAQYMDQYIYDVLTFNSTFTYSGLAMQVLYRLLSLLNYLPCQCRFGIINPLWTIPWFARQNLNY
jgi:hypothetical protein